MKSLLGLHWQRTHPDNRRDFAHIEAMQYKSVKLFKNEWDNANFCRDLLTVLPRDSYILARDHALSEQKEDMWRNAEAAGIDHANQWINKVQGGQYYMPLDRTFFLGINEPDATNGDRNAIDIYTATYLERLQDHGLRGGAFNFSTGHPRTVDGTGGTKADYSVFERSHRAIVNGNHIGVLHIYGTAAVPCAPGHFDRIWACDWQDVEWVVGECGADEHVIGGGSHDGYLISMKDHLHDYCPWLDRLIMGTNDPRIHSWQVFTYDFSHPWDSFDASVIRDALESYDWQHVKQQPPTQPSTPPQSTHIPTISTGAGTPVPGQPVYPPFDPTNDENWFREPKHGTVTADNVNVRSGPGLDYEVVDSMQKGEPVLADVEVDRTGYNWVRVANEGWIADKFVQWQGVQPTTPAPSEPVATGIIDPRVAQAILNIESGGRTHGENGLPLIRFEAHIFEGKAGNTDYFRYNADKPWTGQEWRRSPGEPWRPIHTGKQADEYAAFEFAKTLNRDAAYNAISVGAPQIMGFNHARVGFPNAEAMYNAFQDGQMQTFAFLNYFLSDPGLIDAVRRKDWREIAKRYNGAGAVDTYAPLLQKAYEELA